VDFVGFRFSKDQEFDKKIKASKNNPPDFPHLSPTSQKK
jgi:hypothetical protein